MVVQLRAGQQPRGHATNRAGADDGGDAHVRAPHPLTRVPSNLRCSCPCVAERWGLWWWSSNVARNDLKTLPTELGLLTAMGYL